MIFTGEYRNLKMITWLINTICNFRCDYCSVSNRNEKKSLPINVHNLSESLNLLKKEWLLHLTGGEPFLEKNIIDICRTITRKHYLSINTNLSTNNIYEFANTIDPKRTLTISASVHITEREKTDLRLSEYINKIHYLQQKGFNIIASYVVHPILLGRIKSDIEYLKNNGIQKVRIKVFRGVFEEKYYPNAFHPVQKDFLRTLEADYPEFEILLKSHNYYGQQCRAGQDFFVMDRDGNLSRCSNAYRQYGNFLNKTMIRDKTARPCPIKKCGCPYEGIRNILSTKGNLKSIIIEDGKQKYIRSKRIVKAIIKDPKSLRKIKEKVIEYLT
jgi:MoaA/NifB/PqqE/SkfB family radical SAM enzyme